jgi:hypothetical protein
LSAGRLFVGLGPGSSKADYDACGVPFQDRWSSISGSVEEVF